VPVLGVPGAHHGGVMCPLWGVQVPIIGGSGAHYRGVRSGALYIGASCPLKGGQVPIIGGQVPIVIARHREDAPVHEDIIRMLNVDPIC